MILRTKILPAVLAAGTFCFAAAVDATGAARPVVVELYTSQGCSSCPAADAMLAQLAARPDVLAMSFSVTYWDMLGWKDTLATEANTARQKAYAQVMGRSAIYTPQMIVDGVTDAVGSRQKAVNDAIAAREAAMITVPIAITTLPGRIHIAVGGAKSGGNATLWVFDILHQASVYVSGGENSGRHMTYRNVVRSMKSVGSWKGAALTVDLPRYDPAGPPHDGIAVVLQQNGYGRIIGAAFDGTLDVKKPR